MLIVFAAVLIGLSWGSWRRRRPHQDRNGAGVLSVRGLGVLGLIVALHIGVRWVPAGWRSATVLGTQALAVLWVAWAVRLRRADWGIALFVVGAGLNLGAMMANAGLMPVSNHALAVAGHRQDKDIERGHFYKHTQADEDTRLVPLTDVIALPRTRMVVSVGDILMGIGLTAVFAALPGLASARIRIVGRTHQYAIVT